MSLDLKLRCLSKLFIRSFCISPIPKPLKSVKLRSNKSYTKSFVDVKNVKAIGGKGGDGCISFLHLWCNEMAGPDGGDGGHGAHVMFKASHNVKDLRNILTQIRGSDGVNGRNKDCHGKNADHEIIEVPVGTIIRNNKGVIVGDLSREDLMFVAARGGAGGKGNHFFLSETNQAPKICQRGAVGEHIEYVLEVKSMAHIGLIGFPNAGKSTLLRAISRASPKIAPYPFTTLKPQLGTVEYDDYEQITVADLPGLIPDSHKNKGLGIQFLKHAERCLALIFVVDISLPKPWKTISTLQFELSQFSEDLAKRPKIIIANKVDILENKENIDILRQETEMKVIPLSAKLGTNVREFLSEIRKIYDENKEIEE
ncbi:mitochondrial ribosome-associated GTPase 2 isoform X1 [Harmonia axyridis]|uniref:mitochondrial ribosome-associated GTPase 2 isoform X1 n=2 Tax=Harmonia axyridis TaxID=115357 RepID=UPI001E27760C|nr:mitochondrial ribosome-associated GTPase 2 isoform X1 [Harmonia axyridis]